MSRNLNEGLGNRFFAALRMTGAALRMTTAFILLIGASSRLHAADTPPAFHVPAMHTPVTDEAGILSQPTVERLSAILHQLYDSGGSQIAVLTVPTLGDMSVEEAGIKVTDQWGLGKQGKDNGVLLLIAPKDRRVRIEVGRGLEGELTDAFSRRIINEILTPAFKAGDFDTGVTHAVAAIISKTDPEFDLAAAGIKRPQMRSGRKSLNPIQGLGILVLILVFGVFAIIHRVLQFLGLVPRSSYYGGSSWRGGGGGFGGFGGGGFGGGGGSGWGGGGGGFGGGGSSGQW